MKKLILMVILCLTLMGCQTAVENAPNSNQNTENKTEDERLGVPFSNGPTNPPDVKGPSNPPPAEESPQAVTQKEDIRLTLPLKTE
jgi:hypothetical protein